MRPRTWLRLDAELRNLRHDLLRASARSDLNGWLDREASTTYQTPPPSTRDSLRRLIDTAKARLLRWHLGFSRYAGDLSRGARHSVEILVGERPATGDHHNMLHAEIGKGMAPFGQPVC